jgi:hypothetical protein
MNGIPESQMSEFAPAAIAPIGTSGEAKVSWYQRNKDKAYASHKKWLLANKDKRKEYIRALYHKNREKNLLVMKKWASEHPEVNKNWRLNNPEKAREIYKRHGDKKRATIKGRLNNSMGGRIWYALNGGKNGKSWVDILGYGPFELKKHLEKQFEPWMNWENYGKGWHIDHKIPVSAFNYETEEDIDFKKCWELKNLRPLKASINISKKAKLEKPYQPALITGLKRKV